MVFRLERRTIYFCITGGEGTGKSNYIAAILAGTLGSERLQAEQTLGLEVTANPKGLAVLHYDTEQSEAQLYKNLEKTLRRAGIKSVPVLSFPLSSIAITQGQTEDYS